MLLKLKKQNKRNNKQLASTKSYSLMKLKNKKDTYITLALKLDGNNFEGYPLQSRNLKPLGRYLRSFSSSTLSIMRIFRQGIFEKDLRFQCATFGLNNFRTMP